MLGRQCPSENIIWDSSGEILHYSAVPIVWMPILQFLPVHLSKVTEQDCCVKCLQEGTVACISMQVLRMPSWAGVLWVVCGYDKKNSLLFWWKAIIVNLFYDVCRLKGFFPRQRLLSNEYSTSNIWNIRTDLCTSWTNPYLALVALRFKTIILFSLTLCLHWSRLISSLNHGLVVIPEH